jgi:phosphoribosylformylglycinamidine synthase I
VKVAVVVFPGTNCDHDTLHLFEKVLDAFAYPVWHRSEELGNPDLVVLPGGFSYGDYLRTGALAKLSPVMGAVSRFARSGGRVLGICNGFQILCEAQLLPGVLLENVGRAFLSRFVSIRVSSTRSFFTKSLIPGDVITCPIAHFQGNYFADAGTIQTLERTDRIVFQYCAASGELSETDHTINVNGSVKGIAGICSEDGNVVGLMPHPERAVESLVGFVGGSTGLSPFRGVIG